MRSRIETSACYGFPDPARTSISIGAGTSNVDQILNASRKLNSSNEVIGRRNPVQNALPPPISHERSRYLVPGIAELSTSSRIPRHWSLLDPGRYPSSGNITPTVHSVLIAEWRAHTGNATVVFRTMESE